MPRINTTDDRYTQISWIEKYRPKTLDELYLPPTIKNMLEDIINSKTASNPIMPNIILSGPSGIGKTSAIKAIAIELYDTYYEEAVLELNTLNDKGIQVMQDKILSFCKTKIPYKNQDSLTRPKYKMIIFNEADNIIERTQALITQAIEKYSNSVHFIFTCNNSALINEKIQTKCANWGYSYLSDDSVISILKNICTSENITFTANSLETIALFSRGDARNAINKLQLIYNKYGKINLQYVSELCDVPSEVTIKKVFDNIIKGDLRESLRISHSLKGEGYSGSDIILGMVATMKLPICNDIPENIKIAMGKEICNGVYNISNIADSVIQLSGCIVNIVKAISAITNNHAQK